MLYPFKFRPLYFEKIWGGQKIKEVLGKDTDSLMNCGESWEVSGIEGKASVVENGFLADNDLSELLEVYMGDLMGERNFDAYGPEFPLLVKFIDAREKLSVQVHPDDKLAGKRYGSFGKTEMWYVIEADPGAGLYVGFKEGVTRENYERAVEAGDVDRLLRFYPVKAGDAFFIPAGTVHAIGGGVLLAEIQQSSDCTYRIFDWNRTDGSGNPRELHTAEALGAIHFGEDAQYQILYPAAHNKTVPLVRDEHFNTNVLHFDKPVEKNYLQIDSFILYICTEGGAIFLYEDAQYTLKKGEVLMVPAIATEVRILPQGDTVLLEVYHEKK